MSEAYSAPDRSGPGEGDASSSFFTRLEQLLPYEYFIGLRYLRAKRRQMFVSVITVIAVTGVMVGVAALIIVLSGMEGVQEYMRDKILGFNAHITVVSASGEGIAEPEDAIRRILTVPHVTGASPYIQGELMLRGRGGSAGVLVRGIDPVTAPTVMTLEGNSVIFRGSLAELDPEYQTSLTQAEPLPGLALGNALAQQLGVYYGDEITVIIPQGVLTPVGMRPKAMRFRVGCIYKFGFWEVDSKVALVHLTVASDLFKTEGRVEGIEVKTDNIYTVEKTRAAIAAALGRSYFTSTWEKQQAQLFAALKMEQLLSGLVLSLIMLVASFNIISMLLMLVMEKYADIAILKSMGAADAGIMRIFMTQGTIIGLVGALAGVAMGVAICWLQMRYKILAFDPEVYQFSVVPMKLTLTNLLGVPAGAVLIAFLTTIYPSWQAARMKPAESLRYE